MIRSLTLLAAAALLGLTTTAARADATLDRVKDRGVVTAGILVNGTAFGFLDPASNTVKGFNVDIAQAVADKLGVKLDIVTVDPPNRVQFLQQGKVDFLVASFTDTPERREQTSVVPTAYYELGGAAMTRKDSGIASWEDLRGKTACASQGSHYARLLATEYGAEVRALKTSAEALSTLRAGGCVVSVHDSTLIYALLKQPEWQDYKADLPLIGLGTWVAAVRKGQDDTAALVDGVLRDLHKSGALIEFETRWQITPPSPFLAQMHEKLLNGGS